jgi:hypothetical protein
VRYVLVGVARDVTFHTHGQRGLGVYVRQERATQCIAETHMSRHTEPLHVAVRHASRYETRSQWNTDEAMLAPGEHSLNS